MSRLAEPGARAGGKGGKPGASSTPGRTATDIESAAPLILQFKRLTKSLESESRKFGTDRDTQQFREKVADSISEGKALFQQASSVIMRSRGVGKAGGRADARIDSLQAELTVVVDAFDAIVRTVESESRVSSAVRKKGKKVGGAAAGDAGDSKAGAESDEEDDEARQEEAKRQQIRQEIYGVKGFGQEKNEDAQVIVREAAELHSMFRDFNLLVAEQHEGIKEADKHVEDAMVKVQDGNKNIEKATDYQTKIRKKMCVIMICLCIVALVIALPLGLTLKKE